jgi:hypothetical protein
MMKHRIGPTLFVAVALAALFAAFGASSAMATPSGEYAVFADCPLSHRPLSTCIVSKTISGEITLGKQGVPIVATQTLQGGFSGTGESTKFVGVEKGETFSKTAQKVPGGLLGLVKCNEIKGEGFLEWLARSSCEVVFENPNSTGVEATTELAAPATSIKLNEEAILGETGTGLTLPVKVKLENPLFGEECYIGSNSEPITLKLTSGTSGSLKGKLGELGERAEGGILVIKNNTLVDSGFKAPEASGCGGIFSFLLDPIIDSKIGLPTSSNKAVLNNTIEQAGRLVIEEFGE